MFKNYIKVNAPLAGSFSGASFKPIQEARSKMGVVYVLEQLYCIRTIPQNIYQMEVRACSNVTT